MPDTANSAWAQWYGHAIRVLDEMSERGKNRLFFRGHNSSEYKLLAGIGRCGLAKDSINFVEQRIYFDFVVRAGTLLQPDTTGWDHLFELQHHGMPTRLLDWSETFGVALYFALRKGAGEGALWILRPDRLNMQTCKTPGILDAFALPGAYKECFLACTKQLGHPAVALSPFRHNPRIAQQRGGFTLHSEITEPLESSFKNRADVLRQLILPAALRDDARQFLRAAGISEFTLFPDLDGLVREIREENLPPRDALTA